VCGAPGEGGELEGRRPSITVLQKWGSQSWLRMESCPTKKERRHGCRRGTLRACATEQAEACLPLARQTPGKIACPAEQQSRNQTGGRGARTQEPEARISRRGPCRLKKIFYWAFYPTRQATKNDGLPHRAGEEPESAGGAPAKKIFSRRKEMELL